MRIKIILITSLFFSMACQAAETNNIATQNARGIQIQLIDSQAINDEKTDPLKIVSAENSSRWPEKTQAILSQALSLSGIQYKSGGTSPESGFDCSGFVRYVFNNAAKITLPATANAISHMGKPIKKDALQPGDLVFFNTLKSAFSHVAIYLGDNKFIHSPRTGSSVRIENMETAYWRSRYNGAQRLETEPATALEKSH